MKKTVSKNLSGLKGSITIPADKSISHRAVMFASLANGKSVIKNFSKGQDPRSSLEICKALGVDAQFLDETTLIVNSDGVFKAPSQPLDCGNSGTTMRLMSGVLAGQGFSSTLIGDESLSKRPMKRVIEPLTLMGAQIASVDGHAPLTITGHNLSAINYESPLASAQVKSCILLAGLNADGVTMVTEPYLSRNHTELMLKFMNADIKIDGCSVSVSRSTLEPREISICGDISSAAYFIAAGLIVPNSDIILKNVGLNQTRTGILDIVKFMGGNVEILDKKNVSGEDVGDLRIRYSDLTGCTIEDGIIPRLIDELPVIAVLATQARGTTIVRDAGDLRNKESDRIKAVVTELKKIGADIHETSDGFIINGKSQLTGGAELETYHDHRLAMSWYVAGLVCDNPLVIDGFEWAGISFPEFVGLFESLS